MKVSGLVLAKSKVPGSAGPGLPGAFSDCAFLKRRLHAPALSRLPWPSPHATSAFIASRALWAGCPSSLTPPPAPVHTCPHREDGDQSRRPREQKGPLHPAGLCPHSTSPSHSRPRCPAHLDPRALGGAPSSL